MNWMTRGWVKSLSVKLVCGAVVILMLVICVQSVSALTIEVSPSPVDVSFSFNQPKDTAQYEVTRTITLKNLNPDPNAMVSGTISSIDRDGITITPDPSSFTLHGGESTSITLTIVASPSAPEMEKRPFTLNVGGENLLVTVTITYYALLEVSPASIDFGVIHRSDNPTGTVTIREVYGYKGVDITSRLSGNSWLTARLDGSTVEKGSPVTVTFHLTPGKDIEQNIYSWTFYLSTSTPHTTISPSMIEIKVYILMPPKLGSIDDQEFELKFDKPRGTVSEYDGYVDLEVSNEGDERMYYDSKIIEYPGELIIRVNNGSGSVSKKSSKNMRVHLITPYDTYEGSYYVRLEITATDETGKYNAGREDAEITLEIKWPVDFNISSTSPYFTESPLSIDFGAIELKERGYEKKSTDLTLTEYYDYKAVRSVRFYTPDEYGKWLKAEQYFTQIPSGGSRDVTLTIEPGLEAVPKVYTWDYSISAYEVEPKRIEIKAKIVPINIPQLTEGIRSFRESALYERYPSSEVIIINGVELLEAAEEREVGTEDWKKIPFLTKSTLSLLASLNDALQFADNKLYGDAVESLWTAWVSTSSISSNSDLNTWALSGYARALSLSADKTLDEVLLDEAEMFKTRGAEFKNSVEHAVATGNISGLQEEENVLNAALFYQYAATMFTMLGDDGKRMDCLHEASVLMDQHDTLVNDANELWIRAEQNIADSKEHDLTRVGDWYLLLNPYNYDTFSANYRSAEHYLEEAAKKYRIAGELLMYRNTRSDLQSVQSEGDYIFFLFFLASVLYAAAFIIILYQIFMGTMAYIRDMDESDRGDIVVKELP
jgi:hypothetical protein